MYFCFIIHTFISFKEEHLFKSKCIYNFVSMKDDFCKILKKFQVLLFTIYVFSFKSCVYKLPIGREKWPLLFFFGPFITVFLFTSWFYNMKCLNCYFDINTSIIYGLNILKVIELNDWMFLVALSGGPVTPWWCGKVRRSVWCHQRGTRCFASSKSKH